MSEICAICKVILERPPVYLAMTRDGVRNCVCVEGSGAG